MKTNEIDPAIAARDEYDKSDAVITGANAAAAHAWAEATYRNFAASIPSTPAGMRVKAEYIDTILACVEEGDELLPDGAAILRAHLSSLLKGAIALRAV